MKRFFSILIFMCALVTMHAQKYDFVITEVNSSKILIDNKVKAEEGVKFDMNSKIHFPNAHDYVKAEALHEINLGKNYRPSIIKRSAYITFTPEYGADINANGWLMRKYTSTRGSKDPKLLLKESIGDTLIWTDSMVVKTQFIPDRMHQRYFIMKIEGEPEGYIHVLQTENNNTAIRLTKNNIYKDSSPNEVYFDLIMGNGDIMDYKTKSEVLLKHVKLLPKE